MKTEQRKAAITAYKEREVVTGIYRVRCEATGETWVGRAPDLSTVWNRLCFTLAQGAHPQPSIQAAWRAHGRESFTFKPVEVIEEEVANIRDRLMKERLQHWQSMFGAQII